ncbi:hypothetical protein [Clostridium sp.]|uniref:hypothetical protein n=1 Tax=Clostridium sp. TaxID=1506 RepID=UPI00289BF31A|nr:hypothetical protein [Clostridium sp.]
MNKRLVNSILGLLVILNIYYVNKDYKTNKSLKLYKQEAEKLQDQQNKEIHNLQNLLKTKDKEIKDINAKLQATIKDKVEKEQKISELINKTEKASRGGDITESKTITVHITYYTNANPALEGGELDRVGKPLTSHEESICAMPSDVPYGSKLVIDDIGELRVVDTGQAMQWLNAEKTECLIDIFVPNVTTEWLNSNTQKKTKKAILYLN